MTDRITLVRIQYFPLMGNTPLGASDSLCIAQLDFEFGPGGLKSLAANDLIGLHHWKWWGEGSNPSLSVLWTDSLMAERKTSDQPVLSLI
jgi:hypothetical protein